MAPENTQSARAEDLPQLELETPFGRFKALVLTPDFLTRFGVHKVVIGFVPDTGYEIDILLVTKTGDFPGVLEMCQKLKALGFTPRVKGTTMGGGTLSVELIITHRH
jgi:hypothetical protein